MGEGTLRIFFVAEKYIKNLRIWPNVVSVIISLLCSEKQS